MCRWVMSLVPGCSPISSEGVARKSRTCQQPWPTADGRQIRSLTPQLRLHLQPRVIRSWGVRTPLGPRTVSNETVLSPVANFFTLGRRRSHVCSRSLSPTISSHLRQSRGSRAHVFALPCVLQDFCTKAQGLHGKEGRGILAETTSNEAGWPPQRSQTIFKLWRGQTCSLPTSDDVSGKGGTFLEEMM